MKKFVIALILFSTAISSSITAKVFLRNKYGADVYYSRQDYQVFPLQPSNILHNGEQVELINYGTKMSQKAIDELKSISIPQLKKEISKQDFRHNVYFLALATKYSPTQDVSNTITAYVEEMQKDASQHPNDNIILTINPSWNPMQWNITPSWEPAK